MDLLNCQMRNMALRQPLHGLKVSKDTYNKLFFINTHSIDATVQVYADGDRHQKAARQFINKLQCRVCEKVFHKAFGLEFHMAHEHSSNEVPKKTFEVKTFVDRRGLPRGSKGAGKKSSKKSKKKGKKGTTYKDWDLEKAWMNDDSDESDGQVVSDDDSDIDILEPEDDEVVGASTSSTKKKEEEEFKAKIETFNAETAAVLAAFKELQPTVYIRDVYECTDQIPESVSYPDKSNPSLSEGKDVSKDSSVAQPKVLTGIVDLPLQAVVDQDNLEEEQLADLVVVDSADNDTDSVKSFESEPAVADDPMDVDFNDSVNIWEEQEMDAEDALMQQLEDVVATPKPASATKKPSKTAGKGIKVKSRQKLDASKDEQSENSTTVCDITVTDDAGEQTNTQVEISVTNESSSQSDSQDDNKNDGSDSDDIVEIDIEEPIEQEAKKRKSETFNTNGDPDIKINEKNEDSMEGNLPTESSKIDQVLAQLDKLKEEQKVMTEEVMDLLKGDKGLKEKSDQFQKTEDKTVIKKTPEKPSSADLKPSKTAEKGIKVKSRLKLDDSKDEQNDNTKTVCDTAVPDDTREQINTQEEMSVTSADPADDSGNQSSEINDLSDDKARDAVPFVCCKFVTVESSDEEGDVDVTSLTPEKKTSITGKTQKGFVGLSPPAGNKKVTYKPSPASKKPKHQAPSIKHIPIKAQKKALCEIQDAFLGIKKEPPKDGIDSKRGKKKPAVQDDSDSDIEIIMSPTAPKKKATPSANNVKTASSQSKSLLLNSKTTSPEQRMTEIRDMFSRQKASLDKGDSQSRLSSGGPDIQEDVDWSESLNGPTAWKSSPAKKRPNQSRANSVGTPSQYSSSGTVSPVNTPANNGKTKGVSSPDDKQAAKRRLFSNSPAKVQPKKPKLPLPAHIPAVAQDDDDDIILLD